MIDRARDLDEQGGLGEVEVGLPPVQRDLQLVQLCTPHTHTQTTRSMAHYCLGTTRPAGVMPMCVCMCRVD
jgi:hypothetical protein